MTDVRHFESVGVSQWEPLRATTSTFSASAINLKWFSVVLPLNWYVCSLNFALRCCYGMTDFKQQYKNPRPGFGDADHRRFLRAYNYDKSRKEVRSRAFEKNRNLQGVSPTPQPGELKNFCLTCLAFWLIRLEIVRDFCRSLSSIIFTFSCMFFLLLKRFYFYFIFYLWPIFRPILWLLTTVRYRYCHCADIYKKAAQL